MEEDTDHLVGISKPRLQHGPNRVSPMLKYSWPNMVQSMSFVPQRAAYNINICQPQQATKAFTISMIMDYYNSTTG